jgi:branched-chain amino acid transport system permease protein
VLQYVIAGLVLGGIYAIAASGLVVTYLSAGVLNFAFGALAYFIARFYYYLNTQHHWNILPAAIVSILIAAPLLGVVLYFLLFRLLRLASTLVKIVATVGLAVTLPPLATLLFGNRTILTAPGLAPQPVKVFHLDGVPVTMDQIIVYGSVLVVLLAGGFVLRYTDVGLRVRAMVDSPALTSLSGTNPTAVSVAVWAVSTLLAGLAGVLAAPIIGLDSGQLTLLMAAAFAAVIAAKLRSLPVAVAVGLLMGVAGSVLQYLLPPNSQFTTDIIPSIPFAVTAIFLVYFMIRSGRIDESAGVGGALDRAIAVTSEARGEDLLAFAKAPKRAWGGPVVFFGLVCLLPLVLHGLWTGTLATGIAYGILFLSVTLMIGEGGMVWLCMITFAGVGALTAGQLSAVHGWPILAAAVAGGVVALPMGVIIGILTIRLGELYVALVTLTFGILMENLVFSLGRFLNDGLGERLYPPHFASGNRALCYLLLAIFVLVSLFIVNVRRSTTGMALTAVRSSEPASRTIGVSVLQMKVVVAGIAAFLAGLGGALVAVTLNVALPSNYSTVGGLVFIAVVVTLGIRSVIAALLAGLAFSLLPALVQAYSPSVFPLWVGQVPAILFGLGAIAVAQNPDGTVATQARQVRSLLARWHRQVPVTVGAPPAVVAGPIGETTAVSAGISSGETGSVR